MTIQISPGMIITVAIAILVALLAAVHYLSQIRDILSEILALTRGSIPKSSRASSTFASGASAVTSRSADRLK